MAFVSMRDGQCLYVRVIGRGQPVLLLPGLGMSSLCWLPFILPHITRFRFYMPDFRGHGRSARATLPQGDVFQSHTDDVEDIIRHFGLQDFLLAGISLGATTAMHLQRETAWAGVRRYLHIDQSPNVLNGPDWRFGLAGERQSELFRHMENILGQLRGAQNATYFCELPKKVRRLLASEFSSMLRVLGASRRMSETIQRFLPILPAVLVRKIPLMRLDDMQAYLAAYSGGGHDYRPTLSRGDVPVTLMIGMKSPLYAAQGQQWVADKAKRSDIVRFEKSGHVPLMDEPYKFMREFSRFLRI